MIDDRHRSWRDRHPWLYYRTVQLVDRGLEDLTDLRRCPKRFYSVWRIVINEDHLNKAVASALPGLADRVERAPPNRLRRVMLHDAYGQCIGVATLTPRQTLRVSAS